MSYYIVVSESSTRRENHACSIASTDIIKRMHRMKNRTFKLREQLQAVKQELLSDLEGDKTQEDE